MKKLSRFVPHLALALAFNRVWIAVLVAVVLGIGALCGVFWWTLAAATAIAIILAARWSFRPPWTPQ